VKRSWLLWLFASWAAIQPTAVYAQQELTQSEHSCSTEDGEQASGQSCGSPDEDALEDPATSEVTNYLPPVDRTASAPTVKMPSQHDRGRADREQWETWLSKQSGDRLDGASYWASHRSLRHHLSCAAARPASSSDAWREACVEAQALLAKSDHLRKQSHEYRQGWNSVPASPSIATVPLQAVAPPSQPASGGGGIILLAILGAAGWLIAGRKKTKKRAKPHPRAPSGSPPTAAAPLKRVSPGELRSESESAWIGEGQPVQVQGVRISSGMIYVGERLAAKDGYGQPDNCLINPRLAATGAGNADSQLTYWPSYSRLPPVTRRAYLAWLASDRCEPSTPIGYVFLYFYGLERRLMLDQAAGDRSKIILEVQRLRNIYGANASFRGYSSRLLAAAGEMSGVDGSREPILKREGYEMPLRLRVALGRFAAAKTPIPDDWMLSWVINHPELTLRTPAARDMDTFRELFALRRSATKSANAVFTDAQLARFPRLRMSYRAASNTFNVDVAIEGGLPDVSTASTSVKDAHAIAMKCCEELDAYSRLLGRKPELKGSLFADAHLPTGMPARVRASQRISSLIVESRPSTVSDIMTLVEGSPAPDKFTIGHWRRIVDALGALDFGATPDPSLTLTRISASSPAIIYPLPVGSNEISDAMTAAALVLQIGALIAGADGVVTEQEREELRQAMILPGLDGRQRARLAAQTDWLLSTPSRPADLKSRLSQASEETRHHVIDVALAVARRDGRITAAEVRQLEQIFSWLGLPAATLYSALHASEPVEIIPPVAATAGEAIPHIPRQEAGVAPAPGRRRLNADRIAAITRDSVLSAQLLQKVFATDDEEPSIAEPLIAHAPADEDSVFPRLHGAPLEFARQLVERDTWARPDVVALAQASNIMLDGTIERINDWALDAFGDLLIEEGDPVRVNRQLLQTIASTQ